MQNDKKLIDPDSRTFQQDEPAEMDDVDLLNVAGGAIGDPPTKNATCHKPY